MNRRTQPRRFAAFVLTILAAVVLFSAAPAARAQQNPIAFTFNGPVRGVVSSAGIHEFLGIPYAAAPVGNLRWRPPVPRAPWFSILDATQFANQCPEPATPFGRPSLTEDCLFLNIFTPGTGDFFLLRPVMVWIHGGALVDGESDDYDTFPSCREAITTNGGCLPRSISIFSACPSLMMKPLTKPP